MTAIPFMRTSVLRTLGLALTALAVASCGSISRPEDVVIGFSPGALVRDQGPRIPAGDAVRVRALWDQFDLRVSTPDRPHAILALSGGGANGAFGAGVLVGWSAAGNRPEFDVVIGVSAGALSAPFAVLGGERDEELTAAYTEERPERCSAGAS